MMRVLIRLLLVDLATTTSVTEVFAQNHAARTAVSGAMGGIVSAGTAPAAAAPILCPPDTVVDT
ncbi:hypothetical protein GCM10007858_17650 [Bradyrhizobium liaoningense]|nr:hypothetical protein GCM10007858_17650 [Bradyrhizobium liaoningense]